MSNDLIRNIDKIHTTEMGINRIRNNLNLYDVDIIEWCRTKISDENAVIIRKGKNWYVYTDDCILTVNAGSYTVITAHRGNKNGI